MKNALKYGLLIGGLSGLFIVLMHMMGVYHQAKSGPFNIHWMEYLSVLIPFVGLYLGIKNYRNNINGGRLEFFEGLMEGFKILLIGFVLYAAASTFYVQYANSQALTMDYYQRIGAIGLVGIVFTVVISLMLMNRQHNL
jgi:putative Mn2+ efflux pump MntP